MIPQHNLFRGQSIEERVYILKLREYAITSDSLSIYCIPTWNTRSACQSGFIEDSSAASRLCSLTNKQGVSWESKNFSAIDTLENIIDPLTGKYSLYFFIRIVQLYVFFPILHTYLEHFTTLDKYPCAKWDSFMIGTGYGILKMLGSGSGMDTKNKIGLLF